RDFFAILLDRVVPSPFAEFKFGLRAAADFEVSIHDEPAFTIEHDQRHIVPKRDRRTARDCTGLNSEAQLATPKPAINSTPTNVMDSSIFCGDQAV
ncbi:MAG: hypothetical protein ABFS02_14890, partial [Pseudomonadota bacterium]